MSSSSAVLPRYSFSRVPEALPLPYLVELQLASYESFLQKDVAPEKRENIGLQATFKNFFPLKDFSGRTQLEFSHYVLEEPKYTFEEAIAKGVTYSAPLRVAFRLVVWDVDDELGTRSVQQVKEQSVYMGDVPLMSDNATFVVNGVQRVIVSQMHRSPGVSFEHDKGRSHASGKYLFSANVRPARGSWLDIEFDPRDLLYARIDRKRKFLATTLLMALPPAAKEGEGPDFASKEGLSREGILEQFYGTLDVATQGDRIKVPFFSGFWRGKRLTQPLTDAKTGDVLADKGEELSDAVLVRLTSQNIQDVLGGKDALVGSYVSKDCIDLGTGEVVLEAGAEITEETLEKLLACDIKTIPVLKLDEAKTGGYLRDTLMASKVTSRQEALFEIYRILRPGDPPTFDAAARLFQESFFDPERYDLSAVGRVKTNGRLGLDVPETHAVLTPADLKAIISVLLELRAGKRMVDDIDSLSNRRVRLVGEMLGTHYQSALLRLERSIRERMSNLEAAEVMPQSVLNAKPLAAALRDFFSSSQLSQLMDQTNPLSEVTHNRRLSALGPGGLAKERATLEARDVHPTHYGRVCPVETPEGQSIGLISSMTSYASISPHGFLKTPYLRVKGGVVTDEVVHLSAHEEEACTIAEGNAGRDEKGKLTQELVSCRREGDYVLVSPNEIDYIDVSPKQILSVAASLIPFVENDDASRALMGANMQRQAVPLVTPQAPLVGTGIESVVAEDSGSALLAKRSGTVSYVDAECIVVVADEGDDIVSDTRAARLRQGIGPSNVDIYRLRKFRKTNAGTCINQKPLVSVGQKVAYRSVLADGPSTDRGELALGRNVTVAFMAWQGCGFEDSIVVSSDLAEKYTSIHIEDLEVSARDTKLGSEEITRDVPGASEEALNRLDESGIVYVGANVKPGDILVGKVTPKGDTPMTAEEKLLRAIFGEKAVDMRDTSLRAPLGVRGTVVDVKVFSRRGVEKDDRSLVIERADIMRLSREKDLETALLQEGTAVHLRQVLAGQKLKTAAAGLKAGAALDAKALEDLTCAQLCDIKVADAAVSEKVTKIASALKGVVEDVDARFKRRVERIRQGDDLPSGVLKTVKVFVAVQRSLKVGDKMAGRHGNKGVVSKIVPTEDMPYLADGTPIDMILNPLGVPSRMNVGQILETHLGWAAKRFGLQAKALLEKQAMEDKVDVAAFRNLLKKVYEGASNADDVFKAVDAADADTLVGWVMDVERGVRMKVPVFEGPSIQGVSGMLEKAGEDPSGQMVLRDGRTGEPFDRKITVGVMYMLKLHHLVDQKIHARSVGPYSLITQQPLGGKAQFGGQRLGEMEVWALQGYGAAYTLLEMLTVKSDDTEGRTAAFAALVRGDRNFKCGVPASFSVLFRELLGLGLDVSFIKKSNTGELVHAGASDGGADADAKGVVDGEVVTGSADEPLMPAIGMEE